MQTYDVFMLLVLIAAGVWGYWKGFVWQLASLASIFFSYFLAFGLRVQVAKLIDAPPPWNMFAAMGIVYALSSLVIWIGTGFSSDMLATFKLKDFDRQIGATFGVAKGIIFCLLITFFAVTLLGQREQQRICSSTSGKFIAKLLKSSGGLIPTELHAVVDPYLTPFSQTLEQYQPGQLAAGYQPGAANSQTPEQGSVDWNQGYAAQPPAAQYQQYGYPPAGQPGYGQPQFQAPAEYDSRYTDPQYAPPAYDPRYAPAPQYQSPSYYDPRYPAPRYDSYEQGHADPRNYQAPTYPQRYYEQPQEYAPQPAYQPNSQYYQR